MDMFTVAQPICFVKPPGAGILVSLRHYKVEPEVSRPCRHSAVCPLAPQQRVADTGIVEFFDNRQSARSMERIISSE